MVSKPTRGQPDWDVALNASLDELEAADSARLLAAANLSDVPSPATALTNLGAQPADSDLAAIALLNTTAFGRSLLTQVDPAAARATLGAGTSSFDGEHSSLSGLADDDHPQYLLRADIDTGAVTAAEITYSPAGSVSASDVQAAITEVAAEALPRQETVNTVATSGTAQTIPDPATGATISRITLTGNCTFTFPTAGAGKSFTIVLVQDGTGSRTATWPGTVKWPAATAPTLTTTAAKIDVVTFLCADGTNWLGMTAGKNF